MRQTIKLTQTQATFLELAGPDHNRMVIDWFNRRDVFSGHCNFMPYLVGLSLFQKGLLETDPPGHPSGADLIFRITEAGLAVLKEMGKL